MITRTTCRSAPNGLFVGVVDLATSEPITSGCIVGDRREIGAFLGREPNLGADGRFNQVERFADRPGPTTTRPAPVALEASEHRSSPRYASPCGLLSQACDTRTHPAHIVRYGPRR